MTAYVMENERAPISECMTFYAALRLSFQDGAVIL